MNHKWIGITASAALVAALGISSGLSFAQDSEKKEKETPLGRIMEKVQKHNLAITKATRNVAAYKKSQKEVEKMAAQWVKLAKESKPLAEPYLKNAKDETDPKKRQEKWDEIMDAFAKSSNDLAVAVAKDGTTQKEAKDLFNAVKKTCAECHNVFRVEDSF
jgi:cytochrome c556